MLVMAMAMAMIMVMVIHGRVVLVILGGTWWPVWPGSPLLKANKEKQRQTTTNKNKQIPKNTDKMWVVLVTLGGLWVGVVRVCHSLLAGQYPRKLPPLSAGRG